MYKQSLFSGAEIWAISGDVWVSHASWMHPLCSWLMSTQRGGSLTWHDELFNPTNLHQYEMNGAGSSVLPQHKTCGVDEKRGVQTRLEATRQPKKTFVSHHTALLHVSVCCYWVVELQCCHGATHQQLFTPTAAIRRGNNFNLVWMWSLSRQRVQIITWRKIKLT